MSLTLSLIKWSLRWRRWRNRNMSIEQQRREFERAGRHFKLPPNIHREAVDVAGIPGEWLRPEAGSDGKVLLYLHGGGYTVGSINTHRGLMSWIAHKSKRRVLGIDYRLAPEYPFPAAVEDATKAYRWLLDQGITAQNIAIAGDSAGGGLTIATMLSLRDAGDELPAAAVCISPWLDLEGTGDSATTKASADPMISNKAIHRMASLYLQDTDPRTPLASPIYADPQGLPPLLIQVGTSELLLDDSRRFAEKAKAAGVEVQLDVWDGMIHVWHFFSAWLPEGKQAIADIARFLMSLETTPK